MLYTDASDVAIGASLQQVQDIRVADLAGTPAYDKLKKAWESGSPIPRLVAELTKDSSGHTEDDQWGTSFEETTVRVERVICYWSRTLKSAERNYSATEREALGAKEALVRFQPFIEGETVTLVTDHAALQWARVYENANKRLAAWGAVFAAYPGSTPTSTPYPGFPGLLPTTHLYMMSRSRSHRTTKKGSKSCLRNLGRRGRQGGASRLHSLRAQATFTRRGKGDRGRTGPTYSVRRTD